MRHAESLACVVLFLGVLLACGKKSGTDSTDPGPPPPATAVRAPTDEIPIEVEIGAILDEYRSNEIRADARFRNRSLRVSGTVMAIGKGPRGGAYLSVGTGARGDRGALHCTLVEADDPLNLRTNVGEKVTIEGMDDGLLSFGTVSIVDCKVNPVARMCLRLRKAALGPSSLCRVNEETGDVQEVTFDSTGADGGPYSGSYGIVDCYGASAKRDLGAKANFARATAELRGRFPDATFFTSSRTQCIGIFLTKDRGKNKPFVSDREAAIKAFYEAL